MESFASSSASLSISMISEAECFFFPLLTLAGSSSSLLTSSICELLACVLVQGRGGLWGQSRLRCPCFLQVKHLPAFISSVLSTASIFLALVRPRVVSIASGSLLPWFFHAAFHCSIIWGFLQGFESVFPDFIPRTDRMSKYFYLYFWAARTHSIQVLGSSLLIMATYRPELSLLPNLSSTIWS